ncbi:hypothetical protein [Enterobacter hormaechei]|uniref:hypothetical protein n=1 Tax=Enterobacter hormaechei TaxID=158836 RepID=UPI003D6E9A3A
MTLTKERLQKLIRAIDCENYDEEEIVGWVSSDEVLELARIALASLEAEPVGEVVLGEFDDVGCHPEARVACIAANGQADWENFKDGTRLYADPPAPVSVPDYPEVLPCPVMLEPGLRFGKGVKTHLVLEALKRRAEYYAELEAITPEQRAEHDAGMKEFAAMLQGADGNYPVIPDCSCGTCRPVTFTDSRFVVCSECGNKRCPHANDHRNACTGSNEPGQEGGAYPAAPQQEVK